MNDESMMPPDLWQATRDAASRRGLLPVGSDRDALQPGCVVVLPDLEEPRLAWAVLRKAPSNGDRWLLAATDSNPLLGTGDVAVAGPEIGLQTVRCRFAVAARVEDLGIVTPFGTLPDDALARVEARLKAIEENLSLGTLSEHETEEDPEYQDWLDDVVRPAVARLAARAGEAVPKPVPFPVVPSQSRGDSETLSPRPWPRRLALAGFAALLVFGSLFGARQWQEISRLRAEAAMRESVHRQAIADLESRKARLEADYRIRLRDAGLDRARIEEEYRAQLAELTDQLAKLQKSTEVNNPIVAALEESSAVRGRKSTFKVGPEVSHLVLLLPVDDPAGTRFEIQVEERGSGRRIFTQDRLEADVLGEVRLGLPAALVPPGEYRLRLYRKQGTQLRLVREHLIEIEPPTPGRSFR